ncbi:MAG: response regulator [Chloroflexota bacterium]|nr:response regulator [Chloroflexota bacterium]
MNEAGPWWRRGRRFGDISLRWKLWLAFGFVLLTTSLLIGLMFITIRVQSGANDAAARSFEFLVRGNDAIASALRAQSNYRGYLLTGDEVSLDAYTADVAAYTGQLEHLIEQTDDGGQAERLRTIQASLRPRQEEAILPGIALRQRVTAGAASVADVAAYLRDEPAQDRLATIFDLVIETRQAELSRLQERVAAAERAAISLEWLLLIGGLGVVIVGLLLGWYILRDISRPVARLSAVAADIADGKLERRIGWTRGDEFGQMAASFDRMAERLQHLVQAREESLRAVREHEAVVQAMMDSVAVGFVMVDLEGCVSIINRPGRELLGVGGLDLTAAGADHVRRTLERFFVTAGQIEPAAGAGAFASDVTLTAVVAPETPAARHLEVFSTPVRSRDGERLGRIFALRDITREREIDRMKNEFVAMVSHEPRTPLTSIKGYVDLLREGEAGELTSHQTEFLTIVAASTDRLVALINDLLDISRIEAGKIELKRDRIDLARSIRAAAALLRPQIDAKRQRLTLDLPADPVSIVGDADRLVQVLTNLLSNAHKYTPAGQGIRITAAVQAGQVEVSVIDAGIGLSPTDQAQLFTRFYRSSHQVVQEAGGTGLGLTITRSLVELHGGAIAVRGSPGQGATFSFTLPIASPLAEAGTPRAPAGIERHILVVEDDPDIAGLLRRYLERAGHQVSVAATAGEGFQGATRLAPDLITLDVHLPDVDGFTLLDWLRGDPATRDIPVILITIAPDEGQGQRLGAVAHLTKPVDEAVLIERVRQILANHGTFTILVADADQDRRQVLVDALRRAGHRTIEAGDGTAAIAVATSAARVDVALIDERMPGIDGLAALKGFRRHAKTRALPVVMMTASNGAADPIHAAIAGPRATRWRKSLAADEIVAAIAKMLNREDA